MTDTLKTAKIINRWYHSPSHCLSQWRVANFDPAQIRNPSTDQRTMAQTTRSHARVCLF